MLVRVKYETETNYIFKGDFAIAYFTQSDEPAINSVGKRRERGLPKMELLENKLLEKFANWCESRPGVNFTKILCASFSYESFLGSFFCARLELILAQ
jgi:hypothetical protein